MREWLAKYPLLSYVAPFAVFILVLGAKGILPFETRWHYPIQVLVVSSVLLLVSQPLALSRPLRPLSSIVIGLLVFVVWVGPDRIAPSYRHSWLFENSVTGAARSSLSVDLRSDMTFLIFRLFGTAILVPIVEELFWRGWLMRYIIRPDFLKVQLGTYSTLSFFSTAVLFATEHGAYWDVGLAAGLIYNWWILRTRNLTDCIVAHAVTNACLAVYVVAFGHYEYWL